MVACQSGTKEQAVSETPAAEQIHEIKLNIGGMYCDMCEASIEKGVGGVEGVEFIDVTLNDSIAVVRYDETKTNLAEIRKAVEERGYSVKDSLESIQ